MYQLEKDFSSAKSHGSKVCANPYYGNKDFSQDLYSLMPIQNKTKVVWYFISKSILRYLSLLSLLNL